MFICNGRLLLFIRNEKYAVILCPAGLTNLKISPIIQDFIFLNSHNREFICFPGSKINETCYFMAFVKLFKCLDVKTIFDFLPIIESKIKCV